MKPALSVILFTVLSGAGLGVLALTALIALFGLPWLAFAALPGASAVGLALTLAGLASSTLHLANPRNAWRAFSRFRSSWLSREAVFAAALVVVVALFIAALNADAGAGALAALAVATIALAWTVLVCTAMIYASLKPIRQWHTRWTVASYFALGHWSGALIVLALARHGAAPDANDLVQLSILLAMLAALAKTLYWRAVAAPRGALTLEQAIGVAQGVRPPGTANATRMQARLFDAGHSGRTFLTDEFGFRLARQHRGLLLAAFWALGIVLPLAWVVGGWGGAATAVVACVLNLAGLVAERALFFADARHTVRLYHGEART